MDPIIQESYDRTEKALKALEVVIKKPMDEDLGNIDTTIKSFVCTIDLFWELLKKILFTKGFSTQYPQDVLQEAFKGNLRDNEVIWIKMLNDRNQTSHTYNEELANQIDNHIQDYLLVFRKTLNCLKTKI